MFSLQRLQVINTTCPDNRAKKWDFIFDSCLAPARVDKHVQVAR